MRILFFTAKLNIGGCQINAINLAKALKDLGHEITFFSQPGILVERLKENGLSFHPINYDIRHPSLRLMKDLADYVKMHDIDIIQAFDSTPLLEAYGSQLWHNKPVYGLITAQRPPNFRVPKMREIAMVNASMRESYIKDFGWSHEKIYLLTERLDCDYYRPMNIVTNILLDKYDLDFSIPIVSLISRIDNQKWPSIINFINAVRTWYENKNDPSSIRYLIVGSGPKYSNMLDIINEYGLSDHIFCLGEILDIPLIMNISSVIIGMASTCQQGLACGRPVIVVGNYGHSMIVDKDTFDFLHKHHFNIHFDKVDSPSERLLFLIEKIVFDEDYKNDLGIFGRQIAIEKFDSRIGAKKLENIYEQLQRSSISRRLRLFYNLEWLLSAISFLSWQFRSCAQIRLKEIKNIK